MERKHVQEKLEAFLEGKLTKEMFERDSEAEMEAE